MMMNAISERRHTLEVITTAKGPFSILPHWREADHAADGNLIAEPIQVHPQQEVVRVCVPPTDPKLPIALGAVVVASPAEFQRPDQPEIDGLVDGCGFRDINGIPDEERIFGMRTSGHLLAVRTFRGRA